MKSQVPINIERYRITSGLLASDASYGMNGAFVINYAGTELQVIISDGCGWDHVSVSTRHRCPTHDEMTWIKNIFFEDEETVVHFWPKKSEYINCHPYTLHLWRKQGVDYELPPREFIGPK
jgi:hypothetical protein